MSSVPFGSGSGEAAVRRARPWIFRLSSVPFGSGSGEAIPGRKGVFTEDGSLQCLSAPGVVRPQVRSALSRYFGRRLQCLSAPGVVRPIADFYNGVTDFYSLQCLSAPGVVRPGGIKGDGRIACECLQCLSAPGVVRPVTIFRKTITLNSSSVPFGSGSGEALTEGKPLISDKGVFSAFRLREW